MEISLISQDIVRAKIKSLVDSIYKLHLKKKEIENTQIKPLTEEIDLLKQKVIDEWRLNKAEKKFY
jgi:hypothetical protein